MTSRDKYEQAQAMELLLQQCITTTQENTMYVRPSSDASDRDSAAANATIMDLLAQTCADANAAVHELSVEEIADGLTSVVCATQQALRNVGKNVCAILHDSEQMRELCYHVKQMDAKVLETLENSSVLLENEHQSGDGENDGAVMVARGTNASGLTVQSHEENVRNIMVFAESMCTTMDHALSTITKDEMNLAAQLILNIAQKLLDAGHSLFTSLGDDERRKAQATDRTDRITIEELEEDEQEIDRSEKDGLKRSKNSSQLQRAAILRTYVMDLYKRTREEATEHPFLAGASIAAGMPFIGLAIPVASLVALALMIENYYPEHAKLVLELCSHFIQMSKLWFLLLKISARQVSVVAKECFTSWYEYASMNGFMATGLELASTGCSLGYFGVSYLYQMISRYTKQALE
ncbi:unnamed protein product [Peronospora belbahrii]|uniref:Uncharacterized protein n=1 Tax=Peronospora belbahrii TaxID=622444 RepID=A0AAU9LJP7_9STRA|nr:unnamed protein product [Peronospora belbahrii]CAH0518069.1 unnamed protein product [Peronospora belbahrii]